MPMHNIIRKTGGDMAAAVARFILPSLLACLACNAVVLGQTRYDYFYLEAEKCRLAGDYSSAMELYSHCLDISPMSASAMYNLGVLNTYLRQDSVGVGLIRQACERDSANPWYLETLASIYLSKRDADNAITVLEKMARLQTRRSDVLSQLASMYKGKGETDKAIEALDRIELLEGKNVQISMEKHALYMSKGDKDAAFRELQSLCEEYPHDMNYEVMMANQYQAAGDSAKASEIYDRVRRKDPRNVNLHLSRLAYYKDNGMAEPYGRLRDSLLYDPSTGSELKGALLRTIIDEAQGDSTKQALVVQTFDSLLAKPQEDVSLLTLKAAYQIYSKAGEDQVAETMQRILDVEPGNQVAMAHLLQYHAKRNDYHSLEEICRQGFNYYPEEPLYAYYLGITLVQQGKDTEAIEALRNGLQARSDETNAKTVSDIFAVLGDLYHKQDLYEQAFAAYDSALVYHEDNISCLNNYAYYLSLRAERLDDAESMSYRTIRAEPDNITYLDTYAWILFVKGNFNAARIYINKVANPERGDDELLADPMLMGNLLEHAGDIHAMCGDMDSAMRFWQLAKSRKDGTCTPVLEKKIRKRKYLRK